MPVSFELKTQTIQFDFESGASFMGNLRTAASQHGNQLNFNTVASTSDKAVFQSLTGSTQVEVMAHRAVILTQFFGDHVLPHETERRRAYTRQKLETLLAWMHDAGANLRYMGFSTIARVSVNQVGDRTALHSATVAALRIDGRWTEGTPCFDFTLRVSRVAGADVYSNITLEWFQDRAFSIAMAPGDPSRLAVAQLAVWDLPLIDEGVLLKYDRNNKKGLFETPKRTWTPSEFIEMVDSAVADTAGAIAPFESDINSRLPGAT